MLTPYLLINSNRPLILYVTSFQKKTGTILISVFSGHCYLTKIDPSKDVGQLTDKLFETFDPFSWVNKLKNHLKVIPEFAKYGIRLYRSVASHFFHLYLTTAVNVCTEWCAFTDNMCHVSLRDYSFDSDCYIT